MKVQRIQFNIKAIGEVKTEIEQTEIIGWKYMPIIIPLIAFQLCGAVPFHLKQYLVTKPIGASFSPIKIMIIVLEVFMCK